MPWSQSFALGIASIDDQHKKLFQLIDQLHDHMMKGAGQQVLPTIFDELINYVKVHFGYEETLFKKHGYPEQANHKKEHESFASKVLEFKQKYLSGDRNSVAVMDFLNNWLKNHIMGIDKKYVPFFQSKDVH